MSSEKISTTRSDQLRQKRTEGGRSQKDTIRNNIRRNTSSASVVSRGIPVRNSRIVNPIGGAKARAQRRYQVAVPLGNGRTTSLRLPVVDMHFSSRMLSGFLVLMMAALIYLMWNMSPFLIQGVTLSGNARLGQSDIDSALGLSGKSILLAMPEQMQYNLKAAFPELKDVSVSVGFPSTISVNVVERTPLIAWQQDEQVTWVDAEGVAFPPRGNVEGLIPVLALGDPPVIATPESATAEMANATLGLAAPQSRQLLYPQTVLALQGLLAYMPKDTVMVYDPNYGLGWDDSRGWSVYFGNTQEDMGLKVQMYQNILDNLMQRGITPTMISVEYPSAPFYKAAEQTEADTVE